jgi:hypothetical protein
MMGGNNPLQDKLYFPNALILFPKDTGTLPIAPNKKPVALYQNILLQ